jgi:hypothetical protein
MKYMKKNKIMNKMMKMKKITMKGKINKELMNRMRMGINLIMNNTKMIMMKMK